MSHRLPRALRDAAERGGSAQGGQQGKGHQRPSDYQTYYAGAAVLVQNDTDEAQDKAKRRRHDNSQPAKGCNGRASARLSQPHDRQRGQGDK